MGFLAHLAGLARGVALAGAARVSLPPRFAASGPAPGWPFGEIVDEGQGASPSGTAARQPFSDTMQRVETIPTPSRSWGPEERRDEPAVAIPDRPIPPPSRPRPAQNAVRPNETALQPPAAPARDEGRSPDPAPAAARSVFTASPLPPPLGSPADGAFGASRSSTGVGRSEASSRIASPLSDAVVASRPRAPHDERPIIHVTIDRLEVRAPAASKVVAERRKPRPLPSQSLADYLRGGGGGERR